VQQNADDTWTALFRVDLGQLAAGQSMTVDWTSSLSQPVMDQASYRRVVTTTRHVLPR